MTNPPGRSYCSNIMWLLLKFRLFNYVRSWRTKANLVSPWLPHFWFICAQEHRFPFVAQIVKSLPAMRETQVWSLGREDPLEKETAIYPQYSCLENLMDGGAWRATVHGVAKSRTRLSDLTFTFFLRAAAYCFSTLSVSNPSQENIPPLNLIHLSCILLAFHVAAPTANDDTCLYDTRGLMGKVTCSCGAALGGPGCTTPHPQAVVTSVHLQTICRTAACLST